jgi:hypothetical protein
MPSEDLSATTEPERPAFRDSYIFIANIRDLPDGPLQITPKHLLRRATIEEMKHIEQLVLTTVGHLSILSAHLWTCRWPLTPSTRQVEKLPPNEWRYFVVAFQEQDQTTIDNLKVALDLAPLELEAGLTVLNGSTKDPKAGRSEIPVGRLFHLLPVMTSSPTFFIDVSASDVKGISDLYSQLASQYPRAGIDIRGFVKQIDALKKLPHDSPLRFLGYFSILESLLTHAPKSTDPYDSITRQVKKKIALLDHRWRPHLDYGPFGDATSDAVWTKMYDYRSSVAHGGVADFRNKLRTLGSEVNAFRLIRETTKSVIRYALVDPQLLIDLREC